METKIFNTSAIKSQIKKDLNLTVMVRKYRKNNFSVWLFPENRNTDNRKALELWFKSYKIKRLDCNGINIPFCVNGGEYNSLILI